MSLLSQAQAAVQSNTLTNMQEVAEQQGGSFERKLLPTGKARVRFTGYIECGTQQQQAFQGKAKPPAPEVRLVFHVVGGKGRDEQGNVVDFVSQEDIEKGFFPRISPFFPMAIKGGERAGSTKVWKAMNYAGDANNYVDLLIQQKLYLLPISQGVNKQGKPINIYDLADLEEAVNPDTCEVYDAPLVPEDKIQLFLFDHPTVEQWDSIFIDGTTPDGKSKNYIQEYIQKATNFVGSPMEQLLMSGGVTLPSITEEATAASEGDSEGASDLPAVPTV